MVARLGWESSLGWDWDETLLSPRQSKRPFQQLGSCHPNKIWSWYTIGMQGLRTWIKQTGSTSCVSGVGPVMSIARLQTRISWTTLWKVVPWLNNQSLWVHWLTTVQPKNRYIVVFLKWSWVWEQNLHGDTSFVVPWSIGGVDQTHALYGFSTIRLSTFWCF